MVTTKKAYLIFAILGAIFPYYFLIQFLAQNGLNLALLADLLFANSISTFFAVDFFISCAFFAVLMFKEAVKLKMRTAPWVCLIALCTIGLSCAFPLFMFFRESYKQGANKA